MKSCWRRLLCVAVVFILVSACVGRPAAAPRPDTGVLRKTTYYSRTTGAERRCHVYLPPGYTAGTKYPVLYVLHGIGGTEDEWINNASPKTLLDGLIAGGAARPMILVFPNGRAMVPDTVPPDMFGSAAQAAFARFERDLIDDLIPFIERTYSVSTDRAQRGVCGLSMGGGQALNIGLAHPELFAWVGAFSAAPNTDVSLFRLDGAADLPFIWILCGESDSLLNVSKKADAYLTNRSVPHVFRTMPGGHDWNVWIEGLRSFASLAFK